jgi:isopenicillin-N N-acyltransferase-like protein
MAENRGTPEAPLRLSEVGFGLVPDSLRGITLTGDNFERGRVYGQAFSREIAANVGRHIDHPNLPPL